MSTFRSAWSMLMIAVLVGCGSRGSGVKVEPPSPQAVVKAILEDTAAQGKITADETLRGSRPQSKPTRPRPTSCWPTTTNSSLSTR